MILNICSFTWTQEPTNCASCHHRMFLNCAINRNFAGPIDSRSCRIRTNFAFYCDTSEGSTVSFQSPDARGDRQDLHWTFLSPPHRRSLEIKHNKIDYKEWINGSSNHHPNNCNFLMTKHLPFIAICVADFQLKLLEHKKCWSSRSRCHRNKTKESNI